MPNCRGVFYGASKTLLPSASITDKMLPILSVKARKFSKIEDGPGLSRGCLSFTSYNEDILFCQCELCRNQGGNYVFSYVTK